jgi:hypothetical protein
MVIGFPIMEVRHVCNVTKFVATYTREINTNDAGFINIFDKNQLSFDFINNVQLEGEVVECSQAKVTIEEQVYREDDPGNAVVARARRRPQVNGRRNDNKSNLLGRAEFTCRSRASKWSILEGYTQE